MKYLIAIAVLLGASSFGYAMCVATTKNLLRVDVHACQKVKIGASSTRPPAHSIHKRGSSISGVLVTGRVVESTVVWDGDQSMAEYMMEGRKIPADESITFFMIGDAAKTCAAIVGAENTFVTDTPCCDTLPAKGICLVPRTMTIAMEEPRPERWHKWVPPANK